MPFSSVQMLSRDDVERLHTATLKLLERVGMKVQDQGAVALLRDAGCKVDKGEIVHFPAELVEKSIKQAPGKFTIHGRTGDKPMHLGERNAYAQTTTGSPQVLDLDGVRREMRMQDCRDLARLADALENTHAFSSPMPVDIPQESAMVTEAASMVRHCTKPLRHALESDFDVKWILRVLEVVAGDSEALRQKPVSYFEFSPSSPLILNDKVSRGIVETARAGYPLGILPAPIMGATSPMSLAGTLVQQNAEILAGLVLAQTVRAGTPVLYSPRISFMDMNTGSLVWVSPETGIAATIEAQLAAKYELPVTVSSYNTCAKEPDQHAVYDKMHGMAMACLAGVDIMASVGLLDSALVTSFAQAVIDDELSAVIRRTMAGVKVDEDTLALDVIAEVFDKGGSFLRQDHTRRHTRGGALWKPRLATREVYENWRAKGKSFLDLAYDRARSLLQTHEVPPLDKAMSKELDRLVQAAQAEGQKLGNSPDPLSPVRHHP